MKPQIYSAIFALLIATGLWGCDGCDTEPNVPDPSVRAGGTVPDLVAKDKVARDKKEIKQAQIEDIPPLEQALSAPDDAVTSRGRFVDLMEQGLARHMPDTGIAFASGGAEQPTTRRILGPNGQLHWARGDGMYWDDLDEKGVVELTDKERKILADLIEDAWTQKDLDYPPTVAGRGEVLVLRDGETVRVFEGSQLPRQLLPIRQLLVHALQLPSR
jgi:hypothetical protein